MEELNGKTECVKKGDGSRYCKGYAERRPYGSLRNEPRTLCQYHYGLSYQEHLKSQRKVVRDGLPIQLPRAVVPEGLEGKGTRIAFVRSFPYTKPAREVALLGRTNGFDTDTSYVHSVRYRDKQKGGRRVISNAVGASKAPKNKSIYRADPDPVKQALLELLEAVRQNILVQSTTGLDHHQLELYKPVIPLTVLVSVTEYIAQLVALLDQWVIQEAETQREGATAILSKFRKLTELSTNGLASVLATSGYDDGDVPL